MRKLKALPLDIAHQIYDILVEDCEASKTNRESFIHHYSTHVDPRFGPSAEWRFGGKFGMAGKFWWANGKFYVSGWSRSEIDKAQYETDRKELEDINKKLAILKDRYDYIQQNS